MPIYSGGKKTPVRIKNGVSVDVTDVTSGLYQFANFTRARCKKYLREAGDELEMYMKANHPWQNRTGDAELYLGAELHEEYEKGNENAEAVVGLELSHGVSYGVYLEYSMEQRFAILEPTVRLKGPEVIRNMQGILSRLGG